jgi:hypothetical protein
MPSILDKLPKSLRENPYLKIAENKKPATFLGEIIVDFFTQKNLLKSRVQNVIKKLNKRYPSFSNATSIATEYLNNVVEEDPQKMVDVVTDVLADKPLITKFYDIGNKAGNPRRTDLVYKLEFISDFYEMVEFLRFPAYLLSKRSIPYEKILGKDQIFKQLKTLGLTSKDIYNVRVIRNSIKHKYEVNESTFITENKENIPIQYIEDLYKTLDDILNWYTNFLFRAGYLIPKFGIVCVLTFYFDVTENDKTWDNYLGGLNIFFKEYFDQIKANKEKADAKKKTLKYRYRKTKRRVKSFWKYRIIGKLFKIQKPKKMGKGLIFIIENAYYHSDIISSEIENMAIKLNESNVKSKLFDAANWFKNKSADLKMVSDYFIDHPEKLEEYGKNSNNFKI